jgi:hypothetical protein
MSPSTKVEIVMTMMAVQMTTCVSQASAWGPPVKMSDWCAAMASALIVRRTAVGRPAETTAAAVLVARVVVVQSVAVEAV